MLSSLLKPKTSTKFGFDTFLEKQAINLEEPNVSLVGARPYFPDGEGYILNKENHISNKKTSFTLYNNFGHGGSGVTLSWGCAIEITNLYLQNVQSQLNLINKNRIAKDISDFSIEIAHFEIKLLSNLSEEEIDELVDTETKRLNEVVQKLNLHDRKISVSVLIDDKEAQNYKETLRKLLVSLSKIDIDYLAYESRLITYINKLRSVLPPNIRKEFNSYMYSHFKLGCAQDIFVWYCLRLGIVDFIFDDDVIQPVSERATRGTSPFVANSLICLLDRGVKYYENKADEYLTKSFGFEIATAIRRFYY